VPPSDRPPSVGLAVVTGASSGIGLAIARELAARGHPVLAVARRADRLEALARDAGAAGGRIHPLVLDLGTPDAAERVRDAARALGGAAWLVNNAGFGMYGRFDAAEPARLGELVRLNCEALVLLSHALLPDLRAHAPAVLLNIASAAAFQPTPYMAVYGASKAFVLSFTEGLAEELRGAGVTVAAFCPGPVATEFGEIAGMGQRFREVPGILTAEVAAREALAQIDRRDVVHVPGPWNKLAAAGGRFMPRALLRRVSARVLRPGEGS
jgi:short-subunit dehydrogenase